ncbi:MAG: hypothetical protein HY909_26890 [Deltaproteobacteria bacterium]|nr:hypothetical protein [Deltaproteobacteria bacterium]
MAQRPPGYSPRTDPSISPRRVRDPYADLLRDTRGLRRDQAAAREAWFTALSLDRKEDALFELEMLLKGLVAWGNPRNHPGPVPKIPVAARDFHPHLRVLQATVARAVAVSSALLTAPRKVGYARYLPLAFSEEPRADIAREPLPDTPEDALASLRQALDVSAELLSGLAFADRLPYRLFYAAVVVLQREITRNAYFNPIAALEFRPEFDRIRVAEVLEALHSVEGEAAHRLCSLAYLGCFRLLRMVQLVAATVADSGGTWRALSLLSAVRSDARALVGVLLRRAGPMLADGLERELMRVPAGDLRVRFDALTRETERLSRLRASLVAVGAAVRAEVRRSLELQVPPCEAVASGADLATAALASASRLRDALQACVVQLTWALRGSADAERIFGDRQARRAASERVRQGAWMFALVTRAFVDKARTATGKVNDGWHNPSATDFVQNFVDYFRVLGQPLALETDYGPRDRLMHTLEALREADYIEPERLRTTVEVCEAYRAHLLEVCEAYGRREELRERPLDRRAAAESLRMYLGR